ncbi:MAG TPA: 4-(cytidine 5'-diphospho)-2-C-methyl-D-erythritol kinase [Gemmatimonadaceae bacterium]|nr:4-(cytidine 5'-diphospho)-2-C-methyl-D-erythritol kinase [Gemmatimonadaceae bacterium]
MNQIARVAAQAKVNLLLRVLAREESGYHSIETVFLRLSLADDVAVRVGPDVSGRSLDCNGEALPEGGLGPPEENLAYRAACTYADETGWPTTFSIELTKQIPTGAGLGGGSADAGAVLRALDAMSPSPLGHRLVELAPSLGADVAFMSIDSPMAVAWGRGERLLPLPALAARPIVLLMPAFGVSSKDAYGWLAHDRGEYGPRSAVLQPSELDTWEGVASLATNDFEPVVSRRHPEIVSYVEALKGAGALPAMMSGSGSTVFGVFTEPERAIAGVMAAAQANPSMSARGVVVWTASRVERVEVES